MDKTCAVCRNAAPFFGSARILSKYDVQYFQCPQCGAVQTETPYWLEEAYQHPINISDTGILDRNLSFRRITSAVIYSFFDQRGAFLDYAGGYGILTRLMRDLGFDFYWKDAYTRNLLARGFEHREGMKYELLTCFEVLEHLPDPVGALKEIFSLADSVLLSTELLPEPAPPLDEWWYYGLPHGQHVTFYSAGTLRHLAKQFGRRFYTNGRYLHLMTTKKLPAAMVKWVMGKGSRLVYPWTKLRMRSKIQTDCRGLSNGPQPQQGGH